MPPIKPDITLDKLVQALKRAPRLAWRGYTVSPDANRHIIEHCEQDIPCAGISMHALASFCGLELHIKEDQKVPVWQFTSKCLMQKFLDGKVFECDLAALGAEARDTLNHTALVPLNCDE